jgi:hypothetical protein
MTTLSAVQYSLNGEPLQKQRLGKDLSGLVTYPKDDKGNVVYPTGKAYYIFKLVDSNKKGGVRLASTDDIVNPKTGRTERVRLLRGVDSIWVKEQKDLPKDYEQSNWVELRFFRNQKMMRIPADQSTALEFIRMCNSNVGNPNRIKGQGVRQEFYEYDASVADSEAFERDSFEIEMAILAKTAPEEEMKKHAGFLGIAMINSATGEPKSPDGIRREYVIYAKRNPDYFKQTIKSPSIEIAWLVKKAIGDGFIDIGREPQKVFWAKDGGYIGVYPQGTTPQSFLVDLAQMTTEDGMKFKEQLKKIAT